MEENFYFKHGNFKSWLLKEPKLKKGDFMKNKILATILLLASCVFAQEGSEYGSGSSFNSGSTYTTNSEYNTKTEYNAPRFDKKDLYTHVHRGFYFSTSLTFAYLSDTHTETYRERKQKESAYGYLHPYEEIRLGGSIANVASIFGAIGVGIGSGSYELAANDKYDKYKIDANLLRLFFGIGTEFYPIQNKESPAYGVFVGLTVGLGIDGSFYDNDSYYDDYSSGDEAYLNYLFRFEIGKDWWFSRRWSVGIAFNYTYGTYTDKSSDYDYYYNEKDEYSSNTFGFTVRLSH